MPPAVDCSELTGPAALLDEAISADRRESRMHHLETCPACQGRFDRDCEAGDALLTLARQIGDPTARPVDTTLVDLLTRLRESGGAPGDEQELIDLYFLRPAHRLECLGLLGEYEVTEVLGQGGMGTVLKAFDPSLHRWVAIKVMSAAVAGAATARRRFLREARAAAAVSHDNLVSVFSVHETDRLPYIVMQYVAGESLQGRLDRAGPPDLQSIVHIGAQAARGLDAAHAHGLIHRDIKPANILLETEDSSSSQSEGPGAATATKVKITDFGLARTADDAQLTQDGVVTGTPEYMAPEQARGESVDQRTDLFSLGGMLYAMCAGKPPFRGASAVAVLRQVSDETPESLRDLNSAVPDWLAAIVERLMAKDPAERIQSAAEVATLLEQGLQHLRQPASIAAPKVRPPLARRSKGTFRKRAPWVYAGVALLAAFGVGTGLWLQLQAGHSSKQEAQHADKGHVLRRVMFDFREGLDKYPALSLRGPEADAVTKTDARGLRIQLPAQRRDASPVSLELPHRLRGDFDISLGYELLAVGTPVPEFGAGIKLQLWLDTPSYLSVLISRSKKPAREDFGSHRIVKNHNDTDTYLNNVHAKATRPSGRLRLKRTGSQLMYLVAEEGAEFKLLQTVDIGTADVHKLRADGHTMYKPIALDARLTDLVVEANQFPNGLPSAQTPDSTAASAKARPRAWLTAALIAVLVIVLLAGVCLGVRAHMTRRPQAAQANNVVLAPRCAACGKHLKARSELAGKKVKCPQCGEAVLVPPRPPAESSGSSWWLGLVLFPVIAAGIGLTAFGLTGSSEATESVVPTVRLLKGHTGPVHNIRFLGTERLVSASGWPQSDQTIRTWDLTSGRELKQILADGAIHSLDVAADGRFALAGLNNGSVHYLDLDSGTVVRTFQIHGAAVGWVGFSPDGKHGLSSSDEGTARMWKLTDGAEVAQFRVRSKQARAGILLPDGRRLLTADSRGALELWDLSTRKQIKHIQMAGDWMVDALALTPDGRQALVAGVAGVRVHDLDTGRETRRFQENDEEHHGVALSPDGRWLLTGGFDGQVRLWNYQTGELAHVLGSHNSFVFAVAFAPDGRLATSGGGGVNQDGKFLASTDLDIRLWNLASSGDGTTATSARKNWFAVLGGLFMIITPSAFGAWFLVRRGWPGRSEPAPPERAAAVSRPIGLAFVCPGCGKNLKVKPDATGKRIKCPACGVAMIAPQPNRCGSGRDKP
jgi:serine/threonine-protein kinase